MRVLTILSGILMLATGVFCLINPGQTFLVLAFVVGIVMVINGIIHTLAYLVGRGLNNKGDNNGWILVDALITLLLGVLVLCNQLVVDMAIPMEAGQFPFHADHRYPDCDRRVVRFHQSAGFLADDRTASGDLPLHAGDQRHRAGYQYAS